jgi:hypothetical protein
MTTWLNSKINSLFVFKNLYEEDKLLGIEVEFEGKGISPNAAYVDPAAWKFVPDGSLRGESLEAVNLAPFSLKDSTAGVTNLYTNMLRNKATIYDSMRAGVHVHVNCQNMTVRQLFTFMAAYYCLEDLLVDDLGQERAGNLFCLRLSDAEDISFAVAHAVAKKTLSNGYFTNETLRYAAMNLVSLSKFGTLEFRALRTPTTPGPIIRWIEILTALYNNSKLFADPKELISAMSANGEKEVINTLLPNHSKELFGKPEFELTLYRSIRNIQSWAFLTDWS